jgi:predicted phosphodiesterase
MAVTRAAVLSDIHGALPALEAVLAEPEVAAAELIAVTGDIAAGPQPVEVLDTLLALGDRVLWVRGNADRELVEFRRDPDHPLPHPESRWAAGQLTDRHLDLLAGLPTTATAEIAGLGPVLFCHGTPRRDDETVLVDTRPARWAEVLAGVPAEIGTVVCGHTHMPFVRPAHGRQIVNPGSIGMPYGRPGAHWALLGPGVQLRRTLFDVDAACARVAAESGYPGADAWADEYLRARNSDTEAHAAFAPGDGRGAE